MIEILKYYLYIIIQYVFHLNNNCVFIFLSGIILFQLIIFNFNRSLFLIYIIDFLIKALLLYSTIDKILNSLNSILIILFQ